MPNSTIEWFLKQKRNITKDINSPMYFSYYLYVHIKTETLFNS